MKVKVQYDKINSFGEKETVKEGTEVEGRKAKSAIKVAFKLFSINPEAIVEVGSAIFSWNVFAEDSVKCRIDGEEKILSLKKAEKLALKVRA